MPARTRSKSPTAKMREYRARLRNEGLKPVQIWVPDFRAPGFKRALRRQIDRLDPAREAEALAFIAAAADDTAR